MRYRRLHSWEVSAKKAIEIQHSLAKKIILKGVKSPITRIASCDVSYSKINNKVYAVVCVFSYPGLRLMETSHHIGLSKFPYIPGLLSFRELPALLKCFARLKNNVHLILCDGQGIAHPRKMGIATHLGLLLNVPTMGCAKSHLWGDFKVPARTKGSFSLIYDNKRRPIGTCCRTRTDTKPIFVSPGYKIDIKRSTEIALKCTGGFRIPEPLRYAHYLTQVLRLTNQ